MRTPHFCATDHAQPASYRPCLRDVGFSDLEGWPAVDFVLRNEFHLHRLPNTRRMDESPTPLLDILRVLEDPRMTPWEPTGCAPPINPAAGELWR